MTHPPMQPPPGQYPQAGQPSGPLPYAPQPQQFPQQQFAPNQFPPQQFAPNQYPQQQFPPQHHGQQFGPSQPVGPAGAGLWTHIRRAFDWNVAQVVVSPKEKQALEAAGVHDRLQGLFAWRRSSLMVVLPVLALSVVLHIVSMADTDTQYFTGLGKLILWSPVIAIALVPLGCLLVVGRWTELRRSAKALLACWLASVLLPLVAALAPVDVILDLDTLSGIAAQNGTSAALDAYIEGARLQLAVNYAITLLPVVLGVAGGMLKGAARTKSLFPSSGLPGWFLVAIAPLYSVFVIVMFGLIEQIAGNAALLIAVALLAFAPWLFVIYRRVYSRPLSLIEAKTELARASRIGGYVMWAAVIFLVVFVFTGEVRDKPVVGTGDDALFSYVDVAQTTLEVLARGIVTAVVFSTIFLGMIFAEWRTTTSMREDIRREHDREMRGLERYITDPRNGYGDVVLNGRPVPPGR